MGLYENIKDTLCSWDHEISTNSQEKKNITHYCTGACPPLIFRSPRATSHRRVQQKIISPRGDELLVRESRAKKTREEIRCFWQCRRLSSSPRCRSSRLLRVATVSLFSHFSFERNDKKSFIRITSKLIKDRGEKKNVAVSKIVKLEERICEKTKKATIFSESAVSRLILKTKKKLAGAEKMENFK